MWSAVFFLSAWMGWLGDPSGVQVFIPDDDPQYQVVDLKIESTDQVEWDGDAQQGKADGKGKLRILRGDVTVVSYKGKMAQGRFEGKGKLIITGVRNEVFYKGEFKKGLRHGKGKLEWLPMRYGAGFIPQYYDGEWKDNLMHGKGKLMAGPQLYEGQFADDRPHGKGRLYQCRYKKLSRTEYDLKAPSDSQVDGDVRQQDELSFQTLDTVRDQRGREMVVAGKELIQEGTWNQGQFSEGP